MKKEDVFKRLGLDNVTGNLVVCSPIDGQELGNAPQTSVSDASEAVEGAYRAFLSWREVPAPKRGELVRLFGEELRDHKEALGNLVTLECGKILEEGLGEVQEMIDICDFAVGLSRQLYGLTIASERPGHRMMETWHPLGVVGIISAFNFPVAVWAWNAALALVCGNSLVWKPSEKTPLTALACQNLLMKAVQKFGAAPENLSCVIIGKSDIGEVLVDHKKVALISATGSCVMGRVVGPRVAQRFGRSLLELSGNNAMIVAPSADLEMAKRSIVFSAVGTAGQRCTSLRRLLVHQSIYQDLVPSLIEAYKSISVGNPMEGNLVGPLIDGDSFDRMQSALKTAFLEGGTVHGGERFVVQGAKNAFYAHPALVEMPMQSSIVMQETFAPILYVMRYDGLEEAIAMQNAVDQGLSSSIFTQNVGEAETFLSAVGSDCGIANVNIGPSGAEIGGAFGGEKNTGGGRESGSDAWKGYMRRATNTINYSKQLPLAQGITFDI